MEQIVHMKINKFLLDGSVELLTMGIHFGCFGVGMVVVCIQYILHFSSSEVDITGYSSL